MMGIGEATIVIPLVVFGVAGLFFAWKIRGSPLRTWREVARREGLQIDQRHSRATLHGETRGVQVTIQATLRASLFSTSPQVTGTATLPAPISQGSDISDPLDTLRRLVTELEVQDTQIRWKMPGTVPSIKRVPTILARIGSIAQAVTMENDKGE